MSQGSMGLGGGTTPGPGLAQRWARRLGATVAVLALFAAATLGSLLLHSNVPLVRSLAASTASHFLSVLFQGQVVLSSVEHLTALQLRVGKIEVQDSEGKTLLTATGVRLHASLFKIAQELILEQDRVAALVRHVRIERVQLDLEVDPESGRTTLEHALTPAPKTSPSSAEQPDTTQFSAWFPSIELGEVDATLKLGLAQPLQAQVQHVKGRLRIEPDGVGVNVERFSIALAGLEQGQLQGTGTTALDFPGAKRVEFQGHLGQIEFQSRLHQNDDHLSAQFDLPRVEPAAATTLLPDWPLYEPASIHLTAAGTWPTLNTNLEISVANGSSFDAEGPLTVSSTPSADLTVYAGNFDLRSFWPSAPQTDLTLNGRLKLSVPEAGPRAEFSANTSSTTIAGHAVPKAEFTGTYDERGLNAEGRLFEPYGLLTVRVETHSEQGIVLQGHIPDSPIEDWRLVPTGVSGKGSVTIHATLKGDELKWSLKGEAQPLRIATARAQRISVTAQGQGSLQELNTIKGSLAAEGTGLTIESVRLGQFDLNATGPWHSPRVALKLQDGRARRLSLTAQTSLRPHLVLRDLAVELHERDLTLVGKVSEFNPSVPSIEVQELALSGGKGGTVNGWLRFRPGLLETELQAKNLDLVRLSRAFGLERDNAVSGKADLSIDLVAGPDVNRGRVALTVAKASWGAVGDTTVRLNATLNDTDLAVEGSGIAPLVGAFGARAALQLAGSPLELASFEQATGNAEVQVEGLPLEPVGFALGKGSPVQQLTGRGALQILLDRPRGDALPNVLAEVRLTKLGFSVAGVTEEPFTFADGKLHTNLSLEGESGAVNSALALHDSRGELLTASGTMQLAFDELLAHPSQAFSVLTRAPLDLLVSLSPRPIHEFPLRIAALRGTVSARATARGTLLEPRLNGTLTAENLVDASSPQATALNVLAHGEYLPITGQINGQATVSHGKLRVATVLGQGKLPPLNTTIAVPATGTFEAHLHDLPLQALGVLVDGGVRGTISGALRLRLQPEGVEMRAMLSPQDIWVAGTPLGNGTLTLDGTQNQIHGQLALGTGTASLNTSLLLGVAREQYLDSIVLDINASNLDAGILTPAISDLMTRIDGELNVQARLRAERPQESAEWEARLDGLASLKGGGAHIQALGLELRGIECTVGARSLADKNVISIAGLRAKARSDTHNLTGNANLTLEGLRVDSGEAQMTLNDFPFTLEAVTKGWGTGSARAVLTRKPNHMLVEVDVEALTTRLPADTSRDVLDVRENPDFHVLQLQVTEAESDTLPWQLLIRLGQRTRVVRGDMSLLVSGTPVFDIGEETRVSGNIELLPGGRVQALGKSFIVEHGTISLNPQDAQNPTVDVRAAWRAPDGVMIYAVAHGPYKELNDIELSSDAGLSREEIWQRITGSSSSVASSSGESESGTVGTMGAAGFGVAALGVNELVGGTMSDVEIRFDPGENASYAAAVRLSDRLWFEGRYQRDEAAASIGGPSDVVSGAFDFRFAQKWSLRTELGNAGGTFDLLWQHRY